jgi:LmbE family N-acetylglucosaminyl deacetylase
VERVLVVAAHPDDIDFGAAGTVAAWTAQGIAVSYCIVTFGDAGGFDDTPREQIPQLRESEQRAAAAEVGVSDLTFLGYPDGRVTASLELRRDIAREVRRVRPQRVLCQSPERNWLRMPANHPDHLATGEATLCAVYPDSRNPFGFAELADLPAWTVPEVWVMGMERNDLHVDITDTFDRKIAALRAHTSQTAHMDLEALLTGWNGANAAEGGLPQGRLAETFRLVSIPI